MKLCFCDSGLPRWAEYDARGIFLAYVCAACQTATLQGYRADVLADPDYWHDEPIEED